jgi:hypothetical protein
MFKGATLTQLMANHIRYTAFQTSHVYSELYRQSIMLSQTETEV